MAHFIVNFSPLVLPQARFPWRLTRESLSIPVPGICRDEEVTSVTLQVTAGKRLKQPRDPLHQALLQVAMQ